MLLVFLSSAVMSAQDRDDLRQDTLSVYFDISDSRVDPSFMGNAGVLDTLKGIMARYANTPGFRMSIRGGSSLDGLRSYNEWLAKRRTGSFAQYIGVFSDSASIGVDWDGLEQAVLRSVPRFRRGAGYHTQLRQARMAQEVLDGSPWRKRVPLDV